MQYVIGNYWTLLVSDPWKDWRRSRRHPEKKVSDAEFADDLALLTDTVEDSQRFLYSAEDAARSVGLHLNEEKMKFMQVNCNEEASIIRHVKGMLSSASQI